MSDPVGFDWFDLTKTVDLIAERQKVYDEQEKFAPFTVDRPTPARKITEPVAKKPLTVHGQRWLDLLPKQNRPQVLRCSFPHILERIALVWDEPARLREELQTLLVNDREARQGFPFAVIQELHGLHDYYCEELNPEGAKKSLGKSLLKTQSR